MAIKMTRAEYEAKYGTQPVASSSGTAKSPTRMTRSEYEAKYGTAPVPTTAPKKNALEKIGGALQVVFPTKNIGEAIGTYVAKELNPERAQYVAPANTTFGKVLGDVAQNAAIFAPTGAASSLGRIGLGIGAGYVADVGADLADGKSTKEILTPGLTTAISGGIPMLGPLARVAGKGLQALTPDGAKIMQRVARISKSKQIKFKNTFGEEVGEALQKRGMFGTPEDVVIKLSDAFEKSKNMADESLAALKGSFQPPAVKTALNELLQREMRISSPGAVSRDLPIVQDLLRKFETQGLTMSEINAAKRLFERNVKLDFVKFTNPDGVAKSNIIDQAVREWQFSKAKELGLKNLDEINRETRLTRQLMDDIGAEFSGQGGNNAITLTDWIMLSGADPNALAGFITKKGFGSKRFQAFIAKLVTPNAKLKPNVLPDINPTAPPLQLPAGATPLGPRVSPDANQVQMIPGQNAIPERLQLPAPTNTPTGLPTIPLGARSQSTIDLTERLNPRIKDPIRAKRRLLPRQRK